MKDCVFCEIINKQRKGHIIWEDENHIAFLSIFPNTKGFTVVATKKHLISYCFDLEDETLANLVLAAKKVGKILDRALDNVGRTGLILEGFGVNHAHAKLFPMAGTSSNDWQPIKSTENKFFEKYEGYISSHDSERADEENLINLANQIRNFSNL